MSRGSVTPGAPRRSGSIVRSLRTLPLVAAMAGMLLLPGVGAAQEGTPDVVVEASRQVTTSANPVRLFSTPQVAVHPTNQNVMAVAVSDSRNGGCFVYISRDGGLSFSPGVDVAPEGKPHCTQRTFGPILGIAFASDGTLFVATSNSAADAVHPNGSADVYLHRSSDLGRTFESTMVAEGGEQSFETDDGPVEGLAQLSLASVAVHPTNPDSVAVGWRWRLRGDFPFGAVPLFSYLALSTDGGASFSDPVNLNEATGFPEAGGTDTAMAMLTRDGDIHVAAQERPPRGDDVPDPRMVLFSSTDGGSSWSAKYISPGYPDIDTPGVGVGPSDELYVGFGLRVESSDNPLKPYFMKSADGGETWTEPKLVADDDAAGGYSQYFPGLSVAPNGRIDMAWHDFRDDPFFTAGEIGSMGSAAGQRWSDVYYSFSTDGGDTWSQNVRLTDRSIDREVGTTFARQDIRGPMGVASANGATYVVWPDSRAGSPTFDVEDAYVTRVRHAASAAAGTTGGESKLVWSILGAGAALALGGLILVFGTRRARRPEAELVPAGGSE